MGRSTQAKDILNRPPVVMNSRISGALYSSTTDTRSATASLTALALTGPGVVSHLSFSTGTPQRYVVTAYVDGVLAFSASGASTIMVSGFYPLGVVGGWQAHSTTQVAPASSGEIPFNDSFVCMYAMPAMSGAPSTGIYYDYRLTE